MSQKENKEKLARTWTDSNGTSFRFPFYYHAHQIFQRVAEIEAPNSGDFLDGTPDEIQERLRNSLILSGLTLGLCLDKHDKILPKKPKLSGKISRSDWDEYGATVFDSLQEHYTVSKITEMFQGAIAGLIERQLEVLNGSSEVRDFFGPKPEQQTG
jgi:hypothetical protein